ncbi:MULTISPECIES: DsbA family protein [unclassified Streptomyces]|uniref:2-hydroxychromene-2-carboxylate isomerase n=1 Tax=unclassified Streptomyces TaxID=2593676 RepID=UPI0003672380|nr:MULTISPECIES: DsbA family protein [unclassified Streptomyces]MYT29272.1 disulfide bond formation protein DsbA [Streptomyces sp. SID8354]
MSRRPDVPRIYFSFRSPFSWLALHQLRSQEPDILRRAEMIPYWDPDSRTERALKERGAAVHYVQMSKAKHLYVLYDTRRLTQRFGLPMAWPVDRDPWWEVPHLAWLRARREGVAERFYDAVTRARWEQGLDICDPDTLAGLTVECGLSAGQLTSAANDPELREEGVDCLERAYHDDVFGIPYFRAGRDRFWGLDRTEEFLAAYRAVLSGTPPPREPAGAVPEVPGALREAVGAYDTDTAGGCG